MREKKNQHNTSPDLELKRNEKQILFIVIIPLFVRYVFQHNITIQTLIISHYKFFRIEIKVY